MTKNKTTFNISKEKNFSEWYSEILNKAEITDLRYGVKGFVVIRPWGARIIEKMFRIYDSALRRTGHQATFFPSVIPEENFKKEAGHVEGFSPDVFWLEQKQGEEKVALRPTSETAFYQMYHLWIRSYKDLPLKLYQRANIYRYETKATRPLIRSREFYWLEAHDAFATKEEAEGQVKEDIEMTKSIMYQVFGVPFLPMRRPEWDKFPGAEYTIGNDTIMPDGKIIQQPSTHLLGQRFSKAFEIKYVNKDEKEKYVWQTCYGPAISRILASVIAFHGDNSGLIIPYSISPVQVIIIPHYSKNKKVIENKIREIQELFFENNIECETDNSDKRPGEKFFFWEMKGVPFRIELGDSEIKSKELTIFIRDLKEKIKIKEENLVEEIKNLGAEFDARIRTKASEFFAGKIINCDGKEEIKNTLDDGKIARFSFCSNEKEGTKCAEYIEKELSARVMGIREDKNEKASGKCPFCKKKANAVVYAGKSY